MRKFLLGLLAFFGVVALATYVSYDVDGLEDDADTYSGYWE